MSKNLMTWAGTAAAIVGGLSSFFLPPLWVPVVSGVAGIVLGALHIPRPGDVKGKP